MLGIHEAFCDDAGLVWAVTEEPADVICEESIGESVQDLKEVIGWMLKACEAPVLDYHGIPEKGAQSPSWCSESDEEIDEEKE